MKRTWNISEKQNLYLAKWVAESSTPFFSSIILHLSKLIPSPPSSWPLSSTHLILSLSIFRLAWSWSLLSKSVIEIWEQCSAVVDQTTQLHRDFNLQSQKDGVRYRDHPRPDSGRLHHLHHRHHVVLVEVVLLEVVLVEALENLLTNLLLGRGLVNRLKGSTTQTSGLSTTWSSNWLTIPANWANTISTFNWHRWGEP